MELNLQTQVTNGISNGGVRVNENSRPVKADSDNHVQHNIFNPNLYMLKLPETKKVKLPDGQVKWEQTEADYLPVAARIAWFRREHPDWSILTESIMAANKTVVMKAVFP